MICSIYEQLLVLCVFMGWHVWADRRCAMIYAVCFHAICAFVLHQSNAMGIARANTTKPNQNKHRETTWKCSGARYWYQMMCCRFDWYCLLILFWKFTINVTLKYCAMSPLRTYTSFTRSKAIDPIVFRIFELCFTPNHRKVGNEIIRFVRSGDRNHVPDGKKFSATILKLKSTQYFL